MGVDRAWRVHDVLRLHTAEFVMPSPQSSISPTSWTGRHPIHGTSTPPCTPELSPRRVVAEESLQCALKGGYPYLPSSDDIAPEGIS